VNILHVEDDKSWFDRIIHPALLAAGAGHVFHAENLEFALSFLESKSIDYVILDLAIPLNNETATPELANGLNLASYIRKNFAGIPILILTGQSTEIALERFVED
jgi:DNA-binding response OmpR family regulator